MDLAALPGKLGPERSPNVPVFPVEMNMEGLFRDFSRDTWRSGFEASVTGFVAFGKGFGASGTERAFNPGPGAQGPVPQVTERLAQFPNSVCRLGRDGGA